MGSARVSIRVRASHLRFGAGGYKGHNKGLYTGLQSGRLSGLF